MSLNEQQHLEILNAKKNTFKTMRPTVDALDEILFDAFPVLDHGFVRVVDYMGDDTSIVQAARVSYGRGTKHSTEDQGLINYLMRHRHSTPFEMCEIKFHVKLPIFVARQWVRHRTANINEYSARYSILDKEFYIPTQDHLAAQSTDNKQGRGDVLSGKYAQDVLEMLKHDALQCYDTYEYLLNEDQKDDSRLGLARELARMNLPVNFYTQWYWKIDLHNLFHFLSLRADRHAQYEIRVYADAIFNIVEKWVPFAAQAFLDYRMGGLHLSQKALNVVKRLINGESVDQVTSGMSPREWRELVASLDINTQIQNAA
jgi:thymidylate synthase (FAD)